MQGVGGEQVRRMHRSCQIAVIGFSVVAPIACRILDIVGQAPAAHEQPAEARFEFNHQIGEALGVHQAALPAFESGENLQCERRAGAMHERRQERALDMLAPLARDFLRPQARQPSLAPQLLGLRLMTGSREYFAAQHHRHGDIAHFGDAQP